MKFSELPYKRPELEIIFTQFDKFAQDFKSATTFEEQLNVFKEIEKINCEISTMESLSNTRYTIDTSDAFYQEEKAFFDENLPVLAEKMLVIEKLIFASEFIEEFKKELGEVYIKNIELTLKSFSKEVVELVKEENALASEYQTLYASATVEFDGKTMPLPMLGKYQESLDRNVRTAAFHAQADFFDEHQTEFDDIFDKMVKNRTKQAKVLGYDNFIEVGYARMSRNCYDAKDIANFRKQIIEDVVPLVSKIKANQAKRIGLDKIAIQDDKFLFTDGNPTPKGSYDYQMECTQKMYHELSTETAEFIDIMFEKELMDLVSKDGKAPGGYCTGFSKYKVPFIFSNFNGTSGDVDVLTHEAGHAFAYYMAMQNIPYSHLQSPSSEACEVHSMSMEVLTAPWHELFFKEDTAKYTLAHTENDLSFLPYGTMVDNFQEIIYANPDLTPKERNEVWNKLEKTFRPHINFEGDNFYARGALWQRQLHIYMCPFYYIDYVLASTVALQIEALSIENKEKAWEVYMNYTKLGGTKTFIELVESAGLTSPIKDGCLKNICEKMSAHIDTLKV
ncbi:MAG: M3 family oligoendopeptidase [Clostridia bacterium]